MVQTVVMNETERLIREYFEAFNGQDAEALSGTLADDVVHDINEGPTQTGIDAFRQFKAHMDECYREEINELVVMTNGDRGAAEFMVDGSYIKMDGSLPEGNGQRYSIPAAAFFTVRGGKIVRVTSYYNLRGWLEAIG